MSNNQVDKKGYKDRLSCSYSVKKLIMEDCVQEFLEHHPEFEGMNITHNFMLLRLAKYYLGER